MVNGHGYLLYSNLSAQSEREGIGIKIRKCIQLKKFLVRCKERAHKPDGQLFFVALRVATCGLAEKKTELKQFVNFAIQILLE
jgi:hypothetical protein